MANWKRGSLMILSRTSTNLSLGENETAIQFPIAQGGPTSKRRPLKLGVVAGIFLSMVGPSCTTTPDPWLLDRLRASSSVYGLYPARRYRRISVSEARKLALQALFQAEVERIEIADLEARTSYDWFEV
jgi:hypothetical protein